jgi:hypothetical protein
MSTINLTLEKPASTKRTGRSKAGASAPGNQAAIDKSASDLAIWPRAYQKWEAAGNPAGDGVRFWWDAEREVLQGK